MGEGRGRADGSGEQDGDQRTSSHRRHCKGRSRAAAARPRSLHRLSESRNTVEVDSHDVCYIRAAYAPELRHAIRAIPGRYWDSEERLWRVRLGPDRAEAVTRLMQH